MEHNVIINRIVQKENERIKMEARRDSIFSVVFFSVLLASIIAIMAM